MSLPHKLLRKPTGPVATYHWALRQLKAPKGGNPRVTSPSDDQTSHQIADRRARDGANGGSVSPSRSVRSVASSFPFQSRPAVRDRLAGIFVVSPK